MTSTDVTTPSGPPPTTTPYIPPRKFPKVLANLFNIHYWATAIHFWKFLITGQIVDYGSQDNFLCKQVRLRRKFFQTKCSDSSANVYTPTGSEQEYAVACVDEDLLINVPSFTENSNVSRPLNENLPLPQAFMDGLDSSDSKAIEFKGTVQTCLKLGTIANDAPYAAACLQFPEKCDYGLSASAWVRFTEESYTKQVILSTISGFSQGFQFYLESGKLCVLVVGSKGRWQAKINFNQQLDRWSLLGFTWERSTGIVQIYIDSATTAFYYSETYSEPDALGQPAEFIYMGCEMNAGTGQDFLKAVAVHPAMWLWPVETNQLILLTGALVYKLIKYHVPTTTAVPTTVPKPAFAYSSIVSEVRYASSAANPFYLMADFYVRSADIQSNVTAAASNVTVVADTNMGTVRGVVNRPSLYISASPAVYDLEVAGSPCVVTEAACPLGVSFSLWVKFTKIITTEPQTFLKFCRFELQAYNYSATEIVVQVNAGDRTASVRVSFRNWANVGVVFDNRGSSAVLKTFLNGQLISTASTGSGPALPNPGKITFGAASGAAVHVGTMLDDLVVWYRPLEDFEAHRFLGYTRDQLRYITESSGYWSTDRCIIADSLALKGSTNYNYKSMYRINLSGVSIMGSAITETSDRERMSKALSLNRNWYAHVFLGNEIASTPSESSIMWYGKCITDPYQRDCQINGISVHMWVKIGSVDPTKKQFFISSGDFGDARSSTLDSRGISIFTTGYLLGTSLSTDRRDWTIVIDSNRYRLNEWFNIGFTWSLSAGMRLFLNGTDYGIKNMHPDISYKAYDKHRRAVVGRFDIDANSTWKGHAEWTVGNFSFSDVVFYERWMPPEEFAAAIGSINNRYYVNADLLVWGQQVIDTTFERMKEAKMASVNIGPRGGVLKEKDNYSRVESNGEVGVKVFLPNQCPRKLSACPNIVRLNVWMQLLQKQNGTSLNVFSLGSEFDSNEGFGVNITGDDTVMAWVKKAGQSKKMITESKVKVRPNRWFNLGLELSLDYFHPTVFLNGTNVSSQFQYVDEGVVAYAENSVAGTLTLGRRQEATSSVGSFLFYLISGWFHTKLIRTRANEVLGIHSSQFSLIRLADDYWTVSGLWSKLQPQLMVPFNVKMDRDKFDLENGAMCTIGTGGSYVDIGNVSESCLKDTSPCMAFILTLSIKPTMPTAPGKHYIFSSGGQTEGFTGVAISLKSDATLQAIVRSPNKTCETVVPFNYSNWIQLQIRWYSEANIAIKVDEETISRRVGTIQSCWSEYNYNATYTNGHVGKINSDNTNASAVCVSDLMFVYQFLGSSGSLDFDIGPATCYEQQTLHEQLHGLEANYENKANRSTRFNSMASKTISTDVCLFNGAGCTSGVTLSFWLRVDALTSADYVEVLNTGYPTNQGIRVRVKKATQSSNKFLVAADGNLLGNQRSVELMNTEDQKAMGKWINIAVNFVDMIELYIDGVRMAASKKANTQTLALATTPEVKIGSASAQILVSDLVFWNQPPIECLNPTKTKKLLTGSCTNVNEDLPTTCATEESGTCTTQINNNICLDPFFENVVNLDKMGKLFNSLPEAKTVCNVIKETVKAKGVMGDFFKASLNIFKKIADNLAVNDKVDETTIDELIGDFSDAFSAVMDNKFSSDMRPLITSGEVDPMAVVTAVEDFGLRLAAAVPIPCRPVVKTRGYVHWVLEKVGKSCSNSPWDAFRFTEFTKNSWSFLSDTLFLPLDVFQSYNEVHLAIVMFDNMNDMLNLDATNAALTSEASNETLDLQPNSRLFTLKTSLPTTVTQKFDNPLNFTLKLKTDNRYPKKKHDLEYQTKCVFWDKNSRTKGQWSPNGCYKRSENAQSVSCACNHMTSFAILMQPVPPPQYDIHATILSILTYILIGISLISLLIFVIVIALSKRLRGERYILHLNLAVALFIAQAAFVLTKVAKENEHFCKAIAVIMHLFFVAAFGMLLIESIWVFYAVTKGIIKGRLKWWLPIAWLLPVVIVAVVGGINGSAYGAQPHCWIAGAYIWAFLGPLVVLGCFTLLVCCIVLCNLSTPAIKRKDILTDLRNHTHQCAFLIPLMVLAWLFGVLLVQWYNTPIEYFFVIFNASQGFWVFLCFGLLNPDFREAMCCRRGRGSVTSSTVSITGVQDIGGSTSSFGSKTAIVPASGGQKKSEQAAAPVYHTGKPKRNRDSSSDEEEVQTSRTKLGASARSVRSSAAGSQQQLRQPQSAGTRPGTPRSDAFSPPGAAE